MNLKIILILQMFMNFKHVVYFNNSPCFKNVKFMKVCKKLKIFVFEKHSRMLRRALRVKDIAWNGWLGRPIMDHPMCVTPRSDAQANKHVYPKKCKQKCTKCALFTSYWEILTFFGTCQRREHISDLNPEFRHPWEQKACFTSTETYGVFILCVDIFT